MNPISKDAFFEAARGGQINVLSAYAVTQGRNVYEYDGHGLNAMQMAVIGNVVNTFDFLLNQKVYDPNHICADGNTILAHVVHYNRTDMLSRLVRDGVDLDFQNGNGTTALMLAVKNGNEEMVKLLLDAGADPGINLPNGDNAFDIAAVLGLGDIADVIANEFSKRAPSADALAQGTPVMRYYHALVTGDEDGVRAYLDAGGDMYAAEDGKRPPLQTAILSKQNGIYALLVDEYGYDVDAARAGANAALADIAGANEQASFVTRLIAHGADVNRRNGREETALHVAATAGNIDACQRLIRGGADVLARDGEGFLAADRVMSFNAANKDYLTRLLKECASLAQLEKDVADAAIRRAVLDTQVPVHARVRMPDMPRIRKQGRKNK